MRIRKLLWDDDTVEHLARHGVEPEEVEEICRAHPFVLRTRRGRYIILGQTDSGRRVTAIVAPLEAGLAKIITARTMTDSERRRYINRR